MRRARKSQEENQEPPQPTVTPTKFISIDIESTGLDVTKDRIVQLALAVYDGLPTIDSQPVEDIDLFFNPGFPMSPEVIAVHGITDDKVKSAPSFSVVADKIAAKIEGATLIGFNLWRFDLPMLWEEFNRAGIQWDWTKHPIIDVGNIFKKHEERTLAAAVRFYCGRDHEDAHSAWSDATATAEVLAAQCGRYDDIKTLSPQGLSDASKMDDNVDLAGKIVRNKDGVAVFAFGKSKGVPVVDDVGFAHWMLSKDFPTETKLCIERLLQVDAEIPDTSDVSLF